MDAPRTWVCTFAILYVKTRLAHTVQYHFNVLFHKLHKLIVNYSHAVEVLTLLLQYLDTS